MKSEIQTELLPAGRPQNGRKHIVIIASTAIISILLIIVDIKLGSVNRDDKGLGVEPGLWVSDKGQGGAPRAGGQPGEPGLPGPTGPEGKTEPSAPAGFLGGMETSTEGIEKFTASRGIVEGIIAGTWDSVVIIPLDTREQRTISSNVTCGVAFNWQSRKVYWIDSAVGIKIAEVDGGYAELLISDTSNLCGLDVDQITGNIYYGVPGSNPRIRACDSMGKTCVTVASGVHNVGSFIWDIALFPSEGLMFWSSPVDKKSVTRANMDGTNATVIIVEEIYGLYLDEFTEKLYWANYYGKSIGHRDLNGFNRNVLLNTTIEPNDIAVDGDTLYFGGDSPSVYSVTRNGKASSIANTTGDVCHIALFGRNKVSSRPNPCNVSPCANLCVLTSVSYRCL